MDTFSWVKIGCWVKIQWISEILANYFCILGLFVLPDSHWPWHIGCVWASGGFLRPSIGPGEVPVQRGTSGTVGTNVGSHPLVFRQSWGSQVPRSKINNANVAPQTPGRPILCWRCPTAATFHEMQRRIWEQHGTAAVLCNVHPIIRSCLVMQYAPDPLNVEPQ